MDTVSLRSHKSDDLSVRQHDGVQEVLALLDRGRYRRPDFVSDRLVTLEDVQAAGEDTKVRREPVDQAAEKAFRPVQGAS